MGEIFAGDLDCRFGLVTEIMFVFLVWRCVLSQSKSWLKSPTQKAPRTTLLSYSLNFVQPIVADIHAFRKQY